MNFFKPSYFCLLLLGTFSLPTHSMDASEVKRYLNIPTQLNRLSSERVRVAVIDSGFEENHPILENNLVTGYNARDYNDDVNPSIVWEAGHYAYGQPTPHGTHVAGIIAQIAGKSADILPIKVGARGHRPSWAIEKALHYVADNPDIKIVNISMGLNFSRHGSQLKKIINSGKIIIWSAGNDGEEIHDKALIDFISQPHLKGRFIISLALDNNDNIESYSNTPGSALKDHCIATPGNILSAVPGNGMEYYSGTSMSAPALTAAIARLWYEFPQATIDTITKAVLQTSRLKHLNGRSLDPRIYGKGIFNYEAASEFLTRHLGRQNQHEVTPVKWPILNSNDPNTPIHKLIISSIFGRPGQEYLGGQYMGKRFIAFGPGIDERENREFLEKLPELRRRLQAGDKIELRHVASDAEVKNWSKRVLYKVLVNGREICQFVLFNREKVEGFQAPHIPLERVETEPVKWPILNSNDPNTPIHKLIISSIFGRPGQEYLGGQYMGKRFIAFGPGIDERENREFLEKLPELRRRLQTGDKIELRHVASDAEVKNWSKRVLYKVLVNGREICQFVLFNREKVENFQPIRIHNDAPVQPNRHRPHQAVISDIPTIHLGHGIRTPGTVSDREIDRLIAEHRDNPVLHEAFKIIEGSDLAQAHDMKFLIEGIQSNTNVRLNQEDLINLMRHDRDIITRVANMFSAPRGDYETDYLPFLDQLNALGNHGKIYGYYGRKGIDQAIIIIRNNPELLDGKIPEPLKKATGKQAINLRIALFYIDLYKKKLSGQEYDLSKLATFCPGDYFGGNATIKSLLSQTSFFQDGIFYAPENGYIKNGDRAVTIPANELSGLNLEWGNGRQGNRKIIFADCSGFAQMVARRFHPHNRALQNNRYMSYELAPLYDVLANEKKGTSGKFFGINGSSRSLSQSEKDAISNNRQAINDLKSVYEPVLNPIQNIKPGDILIERGGGEGHVMIAVEQDPRDPSLVMIIELTGFGDDRGYKWRKVRLKDGTRKHRVLRIKQ